MHRSTMTIIFYLAHARRPLTFLHYTLNPYKSSGFGRFTWTMSIRFSKVTHTPSLQRRIIETASNMNKISPTLEALMFSIYCMSVLSLDEVDVPNMFNSPKEDLLRKYQFGCQQALLNCGFLRSSDRDCLTALHLYLVSLLDVDVCICQRL